MPKAPKLTLELLDARVKALESAVAAGDTGVVSVELPSADEIDDLKDADVLSFCEKLGIKTEGKKAKALKPLLVTVAKIGEEEKVTEAEATALCKALAVKPGKNLKASVAALEEYLNSGGEDADEEEEEDDDEDDKPAAKSKKSKKDDEDEEEDDDDEEEEDEDDDDEEDDDDDDDDDDEEDSDDDDDEDDKPAAKSKSKKSSKKDDDDDDEDDDEEDADSDDSDDDDVVASAKLPKEKVMKSHLDAFAKADPKAAKKLKGSIEDKYRGLLALLVNDDDELADWGTAYIKDGEGMCCGLPLKTIKVKGETAECGQCLVTKKKFKFEDDAFEELD